jgi:hypothetical protein
MSSSLKIMFHIYSKGKCLYYCLSKENFHVIWNCLQGLIDLEYEELDESNDVFIKCLNRGTPLKIGAI